MRSPKLGLKIAATKSFVRMWLVSTPPVKGFDAYLLLQGFSTLNMSGIA
jgi:hypothetical protein